MDSPDGPVRKYTQTSADIDSFIESIIVLNGERIKLEQEQIPDYFWPSTGTWKMRGNCITIELSVFTDCVLQICIKSLSTTSTTIPAMAKRTRH
jgi:hypothetical protein